MGDLQRAFQKQLTSIQRQVVRRGEAALAQAVEAGALALDRSLEDAVTDTGYYRMLISGGRAGRHDTGNMVSKIRHNALAPKREPGLTEMAFGWFAGDFEAYFREQDQGTPPLPGNRRGIPAAGALFGAAGQPGISPQVAVEAMRTRMRSGG